MGIEIKRNIVPNHLANKVTYSLSGNPGKYITVHQTGNTSRGADAEMHARLQANGNSRAASWHYSVDDHEAYQSFEDTAQCWAASDGRGPGNTESIHVEICINRDGNYRKAVENGAELVKHLLNKHGLSIDKVRQHHDWSPKNCPAQIRAGKDGITWSDFKSMVEGGGGSSSSSDKTSGSSGGSSYSGGSVVDYLNAKGQPSSFNARKKLAKKYGISGYKGTASQNTQLLKKLRGGGSSGSSSGSGSKSSGGSLPNAVYRANRPYPSGKGVRAVQEALASVYYYPNKGAKNNGVDGVYGPNTADAVERFQSMHGLTADGIYGPKTKAKLEK